MKKFIIGSLVGAVIIFVWSFASWQFSPIHIHSFNYTPKQDSVMKALDNALPASGAYIMPTADNRNIETLTPEYLKDAEKVWGARAGKPAAIIFFNKKVTGNFSMHVICGILLDLVAVMSAVTILLLAEERLRTFFMRWWIVMLIGFIVALNSYMLEWNWLTFPWHFIKREVIDVFAEWALCGLWLAWYFRPVKG